MFELYLSLMFLGTVPIEEEKAEDGSLLFKEQIRWGNAEYLPFIKLYLLCDRLQDVRGKNLIIDAVVAQSLPDQPISSEPDSNAEEYDALFCNIVCEPNEINFLYEHTLESSNMR
jgi:hypothetical protein